MLREIDTMLARVSVTPSYWKIRCLAWCFPAQFGTPSAGTLRVASCDSVNNVTLGWNATVKPAEHQFAWPQMRELIRGRHRRNIRMCHIL